MKKYVFTRNLSGFSYLKAQILTLALCLLTGVAVMAQICTPTPPVCVPGNGFAFQFAGDTDFGLKFNTGNNDYEFTNSIGNAVVGIDAITGDINLPGNGALQIGPNRYAFQFTLTPNYGLFFNAAGFAYEFKTANATNVLSIGANSGEVIARGGVTGSGTLGGTDFGVKGRNANGPTDGYLGVEGTNDFDGNGFVDIPGIEIGALGVSTGGVFSDNIGVLGVSNGIALQARYTDGVTVVNLATPNNAIEANGSSEFNGETNFNAQADFNGDVFVNDQSIIIEATNANINIGGSRSNIGNVIGDDPTPTVTFASGDEDLWIQDDIEVTSQGYKPGGGTWATISDARLKKDVVPFTDGLAELMQIDPVKYKYNDVLHLYDQDKEYVGVIAQDIQKVAPYMVEERAFFEKISENENGSETIIDKGTDYLTYDGNALTYILVNSIKEQQSVIEAQKASIEELKSELAEVKSTVSNMDQSLSQCCMNHSNAKPVMTPSDINEASDASWLGQNVPNPFNQTTSIKYFVEEHVQNAVIKVFDMTGKEVKSYALVTGSGEVIFNREEWSSGTYIYTMVNDGQVVATKKMHFNR